MTKTWLFLTLSLFCVFLAPIQVSAQKTVVLGSAYGPETLDAAAAWDDMSAMITSNIFSTLVRLNPTSLAIEPSLALSWDVDPTGMVWEFTLRSGVTFHDGTPLNADAVVFSFRRQMDPDDTYHYYPFPLFDAILGVIKDVEKTSDDTVVFRLKEPFSPFLATLTTPGACIVSPVAVKKYGRSFAEHPVGCGPFMLKSWVRGSHVTLVAYPNFWGEEPVFKECVFMVQQKFETLHRLFNEQKIDALLSISISRTEGLKRLKWVTIKRFPTFSLGFISVNPRNKYLSKKEVRQAISHLWDPRILMYVFQDYVTPIDVPLPSGLFNRSTEYPHYPFSLSQAKTLLKAYADSEPMVFRFLLREGNGLELQMISLFSKNLKKAGIRIKIVTAPDREYLQKVAQGDYDLTFFTWIADYPDPHSILSSLLDASLFEEGFANLSVFKDRELQQAIQEAGKTDDRTRKSEIYPRIVRRICEEALCVPLYQKTMVIPFNNRKLADLRVSPMGIIELKDLEGK